MARKAVLAYFAERANDDGTGIWSSKQRIADEIECSKQTVITIIKTLIADGLVRAVGRRKSPNGYTVEYDVVIEAVRALPTAKRPDQDVQICTGQKLDPSVSLTPRGQAGSPKPSCNRPSSQKATPSSKSRPLADLPRSVSSQRWDDFVEMRQALAKAPRKPRPWTTGAANGIIAKLHKIEAAGGNADAALERSTINSWADVYDESIEENRQDKVSRFRDPLLRAEYEEAQGLGGVGRAARSNFGFQDPMVGAAARSINRHRASGWAPQPGREGTEPVSLDDDAVDLFSQASSSGGFK